MIRHVYNDGGRAATGRRGDARDCAARAISIATGIGYSQAYALINEIAKTERRTKRRGGRSSARTGVHRPTTRRIMEALGWQWIPTMKIGEGCRVHLSADELPAGRIIVSLSRHYAAVIDGELHDTHDCSRGGTRCV